STAFQRKPRGLRAAGAARYCSLWNGGENECSDPPFDHPVSKSARQSLSRPLGRLFQTRGIAGFDFIPQRGSLAIRNCSIPRRGCPADMLDRLAFDFRETRPLPFLVGLLGRRGTAARPAHTSRGNVRANRG